MAKKKSAVAARKNALTRQQQKKNKQAVLIGGLFLIGALVFAVYTLVQSNTPAAETNVSDLPVAAEIGSVAPDFELSAHDGGTVRLSDFRGQPIAVTFMHTW